MNINNLLSRIPSHYLGYVAFLVWGALTLVLLRQDAYVLDEGAAKSLLLVWSIVDQVASSAVTFGAPDLRTLLFVPAGFLWTGSVFAAKIFTVLSLAFTAWLLYFWEQRNFDTECALLSIALLIISPLMLVQIDTLSPGVYLLLAFALGAWLDNAYRANPKHFGGLYFAQLLVSALSVSLHPAGLAYPLALLWSWRTEPLERNQQRYFFIGVSFIVLFTLYARMGWNDLEWLQNPIKSLAVILFGAPLSADMSPMRWIAGGLILSALAVIILKQFRKLWSDFTGRTLLIGLALGTIVCDTAWATIVLCIVLFYGLPLLLRYLRTLLVRVAFQHAAILLCVIIFSTLFMRADKAHYEIRQSDLLPEQDQLIKTLAEEVENARKAAKEFESGDHPVHLRIASQWPSRTMIACKCDTLPLPPDAKDPQTQFSVLHGITYVLFDPKQLKNEMLARNFSLLGGVTETLSLQPGGVLLHIKE